MKILGLILLSLSCAFAQHTEQPQKESATDLRTNTLLFSVDDVASKRIFTLERTPSLDHYLRRVEGGEQVVHKVDSRQAKLWDAEFGKHFLKTQYEIEAVAGSCEIMLKLNLKGETQEICKKDDKKNQEFAPFLSQLNQRF